MKKTTILTYGLISGLITAVLMVASSIYYKKTSSFEFGEVIGYTSIFLSMLFVFLGVKAFRDKLQDGSITFGKAFQVGIMIYHYLMLDLCVDHLVNPLRDTHV
ncbi:MAG: DUF4199 domain-containing protein [Saprospiraceae bacterium]